MPILKFTDKDKLASKILPPGYYPFEVVEIGEPKKSSAGKSFNIVGKFRIIEDEGYAGKELEIMFNTKMNNPSVKGTMNLMPHFYLLHLAAATAGTTLDEVPDDLDTDSLKGLKFDGRVEKIVSEGIVLNAITGFVPYGTGDNASPEGVFQTVKKKGSGEDRKFPLFSTSMQHKKITIQIQIDPYLEITDLEPLCAKMAEFIGFCEFLGDVRWQILKGFEIEREKEN